MIRLSHILQIQSDESDSLAMTNYILAELKTLKDISYEIDKAGNIYVIKGISAKYPTFVCHIDTPYAKRAGFAIKRLNNHVWVGYRHFKGEDPERLPVGGNDKAGIFIMLKMLASDKVECAKMVFFAKENDASYGIAHAHMGFFENSKWVIAVDREGGDKIVHQASQLQLSSQEFAQAVLDVGKVQGYKLINSPMTDLAALKADNHLKVSMVNISVGFWRPNTDSEYVVETDICRAFALCVQAAKKIEWTYPHNPSAVIFDPIGKPKSDTALVPFVPPRPVAGKICRYKSCTNVLRELEKVICSDCVMIAIGTGVKCRDCKKLLFKDADIMSGTCTNCISFMNAVG